MCETERNPVKTPYASHPLSNSIIIKKNNNIELTTVLYGRSVVSSTNTQYMKGVSVRFRSGKLGFIFR